MAAAAYVAGPGASRASPGPPPLIREKRSPPRAPGPPPPLLFNHESKPQSKTRAACPYRGPFPAPRDAGGAQRGWVRAPRGCQEDGGKGHVGCLERLPGGGVPERDRIERRQRNSAGTPAPTQLTHHPAAQPSPPLTPPPRRPPPPPPPPWRAPCRCMPSPPARPWRPSPRYPPPSRPPAWIPARPPLPAQAAVPPARPA